MQMGLTTWPKEICVHQGASSSSTGSMFAHMSRCTTFAESDPKGLLALEPKAPFLGGDLNAFCMGFLRLESSTANGVT